MTAALAAARHGRRVLLLTKQDLGGGATPLAQGGLAAAIGPGDSPALHQRDTLDAGAACAIQLPWPRWCPGPRMRSPAWPGWVPGWSAARCTWRAATAQPDRDRRGRRVAPEVHRVLQEAVAASRVQVLTRCVVLDALTGEDGSVGGVLAGICDDDGSLRAWPGDGTWRWSWPRAASARPTRRPPTRTG